MKVDDHSFSKKRKGRKRKSDEIDSPVMESPKKKRKSDEFKMLEDSPRKRRKSDEFKMLFDDSSNDSIRDVKSDTEMEVKGVVEDKMRAPIKRRRRKAEAFLVDFSDFTTLKTTPASDRSYGSLNSSQEDDCFKTPLLDAPYLDLCLDGEPSVQTRFEKNMAALAKSLAYQSNCFELIKCQQVRESHIGNPSTVILDCRFDYEFYGGHLRGAIKCETREDIEKIFTKYEHDVDKTFVIHCEFSACRAPRAARYLSCLYKFYTSRSPKIYVMNGGYSNFWKEFRHDTKSNDIFEVRGYVKECSLLFKCRQARKNSNHSWREVLVGNVPEEDSDDSLCPDDCDLGVTEATFDTVF